MGHCGAGECRGRRSTLSVLVSARTRPMRQSLPFPQHHTSLIYCSLKLIHPGHADPGLLAKRRSPGDEQAIRTARGCSIYHILACSGVQSNSQAAAATAATNAQPSWSRRVGKSSGSWGLGPKPCLATPYCWLWWFCACLLESSASPCRSSVAPGEQQRRYPVLRGGSSGGGGEKGVVRARITSQVCRCGTSSAHGREPESFGGYQPCAPSTGRLNLWCGCEARAWT
jgi:hypothetical protein